MRIEPPFRAATPDDAPAPAEPGRSGWEIGRQRVRRDVGGTSWRNGMVVEAGGVAAASLFGGTWYASVPVMLPERRRNGLGTSLSRLPDRLAVRHGRLGTSVVMAAGNLDARVLPRKAADAGSPD